VLEFNSREESALNYSRSFDMLGAGNCQHGGSSSVSKQMALRSQIAKAKNQLEST
jgi:hypothetical protein